MNWSAIGKQCSHFLLLFLISGAAIAAPTQEILTDGGHAHDEVYAGEGNDVLVYTPSLNIGKTDLYDGGKGIDTLWLRMTEKEYENPKFRADMIVLHTQILFEGNQETARGQGPLYHFQDFNLDLRNIENVIVERINPRIKSEPFKLMYQPIKITNPESESLT